MEFGSPERSYRPQESVGREIPLAPAAYRPEPVSIPITDSKTYSVVDGRQAWSFRLPSGRPTLVERVVDDLADKAVTAAVWRGLEVAADALCLGAGRFVHAARLTINLVDAAGSAVSGRGVDLTVPFAVNPESGFSLDFRMTVGADETSPRAAYGLETGLDPFEPPHRGELELAAVPAGSPEVSIVRPHTEILEQTHAHEISARTLYQFVQQQPGDRPEPPVVIVYADPQSRAGLVVMALPGREPYCPVLFTVEPPSAQPGRVRLWTTSGYGRPRLTSIPIEQIRPPEWNAAYRPLWSHLDLDTEQAVHQEHRSEITLIQRDIDHQLRPGESIVDGVDRAYRSGNLDEYEPGIVAFALVDLARQSSGEPPDDALIAALFAAARLKKPT